VLLRSELLLQGHITRDAVDTLPTTVLLEFLVAVIERLATVAPLTAAMLVSAA
jgi:hypothetical protein